MTQYGFCIDLNRCTGCKACAMACKDRNNLELGIKYRKVMDYAGGSWSEENGVLIPDGIFSYSVTMACNHCERPACVEICPTGAMTKDPETGAVTSDPNVCIGCGSCVNACPYSEPRLVEDGTRCGKCDMCIDLVSNNENPRCVDACVMRCLAFGPIEDLRAEFGENANVSCLPDSSLTDPALVVVLNRLDPDGTTPGAIINSPEEIA